MNPRNRRIAFGFASASLVAFSFGQDQDQEARAVPPPQQGTPDPNHFEPEVMYGELVGDVGSGVVETMEEVLLREAMWDPASQTNRRERNGRQGTWTVPGIRKNQFPHSGTHYVFNKWGDTEMGIGFPRAVDVSGGWFAAVGNRGAWATAVRAVGYRDGEVVAETDWFRDIDQTPSFFAMNLSGVDRIVIIAEAASGAGWYGLDDLTYTDAATGREVVVDFEGLAFEDGLAGSGYAGLTWERGTGSFAGSATSNSGGNNAPGGGPGGTGVQGGGGPGTYTGNGTLPILLDTITGTKMFDTGANAFPPDTCGAVGIDHFVSCVNSNISIFEKVTGNQVLSTSLGSFFASSFPGDPRVVFDPDSQRFFVIATNFNNRIFLAVSTTSDPTGSWFKSFWNPAAGSDAGKWPDYPTLGVDQRWVMSSSYMVGGGQNMSLFVVEKASLVAASQSMGTIHAFRGLAWEGAIQPAVHWEDAGEAYCVSVNQNSRIRVRTIKPPVTNPSMTSSFVNLSASFSNPPDAPALGSNTNLDTVGTRLMNAQYRLGSVWTAHTIATGGRASSRFYELDPVALTEIQLGTVRDNVTNELHYFFPSIAVNSQGHVALGGTVSSANQFPGCFYTGRLASDPPGEMAQPFEYNTGKAAYNRTDGSGRNRWGDYSLTTADPVDDTAWTIQEHSRTQNRWGTNIAHLAFTGGGDCDGNITRYCDPSALGTGIEIDTCDLGVGSINLTYTNGTPGQVGYLLVGAGSGIVTDPPGATGDLCLSGMAIGRYTPDLGVLDSAGSFSTDIINGNVGNGNGDLPGTIGGSIQPGDTWNFQFWGRHIGVSSTFTDALAVTFK